MWRLAPDKQIISKEGPFFVLWPTKKVGQKVNNNKGLWAYSYLLNNIRPAALVAV
jgi:hypothetical protein